jgi:hypothetical protein
MRVHREFLARNLCFTDDTTGDLVYVAEPLPDSTKIDYGTSLKVVRGRATAVLRITSINDDTQCEVAHVQHLDTGGFVPERVMVAKLPQALHGVVEMREAFQRDDEVNKAEMDELAAIIVCVARAQKNDPFTTEIEN